jgi:DNA-binding CsgD family transcriptional regulator
MVSQGGSSAQPGRSAFHLTAREIEVLKLIATGMSTKQIAISLQIAFKTAACHRSRIMDKLGIHEVAGLTRYAIRQGYIEIDRNNLSADHQEQLAEQVRQTYAEYKRAIDAHAVFQKERETFGLDSPNGSAGGRGPRDREKLAYEKYHASLVALRKFLLPEAD